MTKYVAPYAGIVQELRDASDDVLSRIDGGEECRAEDAWLTALACLLYEAGTIIEGYRIDCWGGVNEG